MRRIPVVLIGVDGEDVAHVAPLVERGDEAVEVLPPEGLVLAAVVIDGSGRVGVGALLGGAVGLGRRGAVGRGSEREESGAQR